MSEKKACQFSKCDKIMIRLLQIIAVVCVIDMVHVLWRCMG